MDSIAKLNLNDLKGFMTQLRDVKITPKNTLKCVTAIGITFWLYKSYKIYLKRRKLKHIPGPPANGYRF